MAELSQAELVKNAVDEVTTATVESQNKILKEFADAKEQIKLLEARVEKAEEGATVAQVLEKIETANAGRHEDLVSIMQSNGERYVTETAGVGPKTALREHMNFMGLRTADDDPNYNKIELDLKITNKNPEIKKLALEHERAFHDYVESKQWLKGPAKVKALELSDKLMAAISEQGKKEYPKVYMAEVNADIPAEGGIFVPQTEQADLIRREVRMGAIRSLARYIQSPIGVGNSTRIRVQKERATMQWASSTDNSLARTGAPTWGFVNLTMQEGYVKIGVARHWRQDAPQSAMEAVQDDLRQALRDGPNEAFWSGDKQDRPQGILKKSTADNADFDDNDVTLARVKTGAAAGFEDFDASNPKFIGKPIMDMVDKIPFDRQTGGMAYVMHPTTLTTIRALVDANGLPLWERGFMPGAPSTLNGGIPVLLDEFMPKMAANAFFVALIARNAYGIIEKSGAPLLIIDEITQDQEVIFRYMHRIGGNVIDPRAVALLQAAA